MPRRHTASSVHRSRHEETTIENELPSIVRELVASLPDEPRWVYARSALLAGSAEVRGTGIDSALVLDGPTAILVGRPDHDLLRDVPASALLVQADAAAAARSALPGWTCRWFVVHAQPEPYRPTRPPPPDVVMSVPLDPSVLEGLPDDVRADAADTAGAAVRVVDGTPVAVCTVADMSESWWDIGIDTVEPYRRRGHATAVFHAMATTMAARGRRPVWAAYEGDTPSLTLAARLGFRPVDRIAELTPPDPAPSV